MFAWFDVRIHGLQLIRLQRSAVARTNLISIVFVHDGNYVVALSKASDFFFITVYNIPVGAHRIFKYVYSICRMRQTLGLEANTGQQPSSNNQQW